MNETQKKRITQFFIREEKELGIKLNKEQKAKFSKRIEELCEEQYENGYNIGYDEGYNDGYSDGEDSD